MSKSKLAKQVKEEMKINNADPASFEDTLELVKTRTLEAVVSLKNIVAIKVMLANGEKVSISALKICITKKYTKLFKFLLDLLDTDNEDENLLVPTIIKYNRIKMMKYLLEKNVLTINPLIEAVRQNNKEMFFLLLEKYPLKKTEIFLGDAVPYRAGSVSRDLEIFNFLLNRGFNVDAKNSQPLSEAIFRDNLEAVQILLKNGAKLTRKKLLDNALEYSSLEVLKLLFQVGLKIETLSMPGLNCCIKRDTNDVFEFLLTNYKNKITFTLGTLKLLKRYSEKRAIYERVMRI